MSKEEILIMEEILVDLIKILIINMELELKIYLDINLTKVLIIEEVVLILEVVQANINLIKAMNIDMVE